MKSEVVQMKLLVASQTKSAHITLPELENALCALKKGKSRDPFGLISELFHPDCIGDDLKISLLTMLNRIKIDGKLPVFMRTFHVTTIPKAGTHLELTNERGIFLVSVLRKVPMQILYKGNTQPLKKTCQIVT